MKSKLTEKDVMANAKKLVHRVLDDPKVLETLSEVEIRHAMVASLKALSEVTHIAYGKWTTVIDAEHEAKLVAQGKKRTPPRTLRSWVCRKCYHSFYADGIFDAMRQIELQVRSRVVQFATPDDARRWVFCPKCWSADIRKSNAEEEQGDANSIATVTDVAGMTMDDIRANLPKFEISAEARREVMDDLWCLCSSLSRGCELAREDDESYERPVEKKKTRTSKKKALTV
jgi:hypothetical protein